MLFGSVCSGIEAASVAFEPLGWKAAWFSEIEPFPCAVLAHHYPSVENVGDMRLLPTLIDNGSVVAPDVLCGGTPCQAFSMAGFRQSLADERGSLTLTFCDIADAIDAKRQQQGQPPCIVLWENVPGVLSVNDNAFGCFLGQLSGETVPLLAPGGKWTNAGVVYGPKRTVAWRILDAQYFGLAQRRRRVFVVASARDDFDPAEVLFESKGVRRDIAPSRESRQVAPTIPARSSGGGGLGTDFDLDGGLIFTEEVAKCITTGEGARQDWETCNFVAFHPSQDPISSTDGSTHALGCGSHSGQATVAVAYGLRTANTSSNGWGVQEEVTHTLDQAMGVAVAVALRGREGGAVAELGGEVQNCLRASSGGGDKSFVLASAGVRRLTPRECERLQGFPDDYTRIPWRGKPADECPDGPRYKALGNSWAVPVVRWIGNRIDAALRHA